MNILVTDGDNRSALAVTRSLGRLGHTVLITDTKKKSLASSSRFCSRSIATPDPLHHAAAYAGAIMDIADREKIDTIFPMTEQSIYALNRFRDSLPAATLLACPPQSVMESVSDKSALCKMAERLQVAIPKTLYLDNADDLARIIDQIDTFPVVVKPALSRIQVGEGFLPGGVCYASDRYALEKLYASRPVLKYPSLIQEKIVGSGTGLFTLYGENRHLALFSHKRLREKPPSGGVSVVSESVVLDQEMVAASGRLLSAVGWSGVAMVEFKRDRRDGKAKLMEINGRFWGSLQLAITCGVDFPALLLGALHGTSSSALVDDYPAGQKLKWFLGTLDHLIIRLKNNNATLNLTQTAPSKCRAVADFLRIWEKDTSFDVISKNDIAPFRYEIASYLKNLKRRS
ncbi:MAG: ATP-grasp domain-containing protein [Desulfuromonadales bacterium]|nr:ATP-grasp domain-containing protein [Desulfuromonadales bacterium]